MELVKSIEVSMCLALLINVIWARVEPIFYKKGWWQKPLSCPVCLSYWAAIPFCVLSYSIFPAMGAIIISHVIKEYV